jgi:hypothetical protein
MESAYNKLESMLPEYIDRLKNRTNTEDKIVHEFTYLIQKVFDVGPDELDFQTPVKSKVLQVRGRMDAVFNNIILEFKKDLNDERALNTAKDELEKYFQSLYEKNPKTKHIGIATDGLYFKVYQPIIENNKVSKLELINEINLDASTIEIIFNWFDSYFFASVNIVPTSDHLKQTFGLNSATYSVVRQELLKLFDEVKDNRRIKIKYDNWSKFLEIVYGDKPNEINLFIAHTYLSTFVKLLVYLKLTNKNQIRNYDIPPILYGNVFSQLGIRNFVEDDFFTWIMFISIRRQSSKIFEPILRELQMYDLDQMDEDVLKELYQEMVKPDVRKQLGEFYTPDWLAEQTIDEVLSDDPKKSVLDPSCGSGTFLFKTILYKIKKFNDDGMKDSEILSHILENVIGFDIHPLAALIAKTNYLLALKGIINARKGSITIPVYLSDSIKIPEKKFEIINSLLSFEFSTDVLNKKFLFPKIFADDIKQMDELIEKMKEHGQELEEKIDLKKEKKYIDLVEVEKNLKQSFEKSIHNIKNTIVKKIMLDNMQTLFDLIKEDSDSIWPYVLRNMYKPIPITEKKVDVIIGNPPWLTMQGMKNESYQNFLKNKTFYFNLIEKKDTHQFPHLELATLFFCITVDLYLKNSGEIAFVLPKSILVSSHHKNFIKFNNPKMNLVKIYDVEKVTPLFQIPTCVIFCKMGGDTKYPVNQLTLSGKLPETNCGIIKAKKHLTFENTKYEPVDISTKQSPYFEKFDQGATIVPRNLFFVIPEINSMGLGLNFESPLVESNPKNSTKLPWSKVTIKKEIESNFFFGTVLGSDIVPFGIRQLRLIVLPMTIKDGKPHISNDYSDLQKNGYPKAARYFEEVEQLWNKYKTEKQKDTSIYKWINFRNKISTQNLNKKFKILYVASSTYLAACVIEQGNGSKYKTNSRNIPLNGFIAESKTYNFETDNKDEADYLCAILNSKVIDNLIKPLQTRGLWGPRDIHKRPLTLPIPIFNSKDKQHKKICDLSLLCQNKVPIYLDQIKMDGVGSIRTEIRKKLKNELEEIDVLVKQILINEDPKITKLLDNL